MKKKVFLIPLAMFMAAGTVSLAGCGDQKPDPTPVVQKLESISVSKLPTKLEYNAGDAFDPTGLEVTAKYSDGSTKVLAGTDYTLSPTQSLPAGTTKVTVSYEEGGVSKTAEIGVTVHAAPVAKVLSEIVVATQPTQTHYVAGDDFNPEGMSISAKYSDGSEATIAGTDYTISPLHELVAGTDHVTITYEEGGVSKSVNVAITVDALPVEKVLKDIIVDIDPNKTDYLEHEDFDPEGMEVYAIYSDESRKEIFGNEYTIDPLHDLAEGTDHVTVSYTEGDVTKTATVAITVKAAEPVVVHVDGVHVNDLFPAGLYVGDTYQITANVTPEDADDQGIIFTSENPEIATVDAKGLVSAISEGETNIIVAAHENSEISKKVQIKVVKHAIELPDKTSDGFIRAETGELQNGSEINFISAFGESIFVAGAPGKNNIPAVESSIEDEKIVKHEDAASYILVENADSTYSFQTSDGKYLAATGGSKNNYLQPRDTLDDKAKFNISIENGFASIVCIDAGTERNSLFFNSNNNIFSCYGDKSSDAKYAPVALFQKVPEPVVLTSISADMDNKSYLEGEKLDLTGLVVIGHYSDDSEAEITEGYSLSMNEGDILALTDTSLDVTYEDFNCSIPLTVREASITLESISISGVKETYYEGQLLGEVVVTAHYNDSSSDAVTAELKIGDSVVDASHVMEMGESKVVATYKEKTAEAEFTVLEDVIESIAVSSEHRSFIVGAEFVNETVTATYASGKTEDVTESSDFSGYDMETAGEQDVTVTFGELEPISYKITVNEVTPIIEPGTYYIKSGGKYLVANADSTKQPLAVDNADDATPFDFLLQKGTDNQYKLKVHGEDKYLYVTANNNGVRIGSTDMVWTIGEGTAIVGEEPVVGGYNLAGVDSKGDSRVLTLYESGPDFRCYVLDEKGQATNRKDNTFVEKYIEKTLDSIAVTSQPTQNSYYVGDTFNPAGMVVKAHYVWEGGGSEDVEITDYTLSVDAPFTAEDIGTKTITVSYQGKTTTFDVTVEARVATLTSISIDGEPETTEYYEGQAYSSAGLSVTAHYDDESTADITQLVTISIDKEIASLDDTSITYSVEYEGKQANKVVDVSVEQANVSDVLTANTFLAETSSGYVGFENVVSTAGIKYSGKATRNTSDHNGALQLNTSSNQSCIFTSLSNREVKKVSAVFNGNNTKKISVYGKDASFSSNDSTGATLLGELSATGSFDVTGSYRNILIVSNGAVYLDSITVEWDSTVLENKAESISLSESEKTIGVGETTAFDLVAKLDGIGDPGSVTWSSDSEHATVSNGHVVGVSAGTANITATSVLNSSLKATCVVTVTEGKTETTVYDLDTTLEANKGSNTSYTSSKDETFEGVTWNVVGNTGQSPWRIGGKKSSGQENFTADRVLYTKTAASSTLEIDKAILTFGTASNKTMFGNVTFEVYSTAAGAAEGGETDRIFSDTQQGVASSSLTFTAAENTSWKNCYFRITIQVTITSTSTQYVQFTGFTLKGQN